MLNRDEFLRRHPEFRPGMMAYSSDGEQLGEIQKLDDQTLTIEKGRFFDSDCVLGYDEVADLRNGQVMIRRSRSDLDQGRGPGLEGREERQFAGTVEEHGQKAGLPLQEEEARAGFEFRETRAEEAGMPRSGVEQSREEKIKVERGPRREKGK